MNKQELKKLGSIQQVAYARKIRFDEGRASEMKAIAVKSGEIEFIVAIDKCMDLAQLSYKGIGLNFLSKPGLQNRGHYDTNGSEAQRSIMGGFMFTCGTENVGGPEMDNNTLLTMHGRLRSTPAEHVCSDAYWDEDEFKIKLSGEMRQAMLFGENIVLRRTIESVLGSNVIHIHDEVENQAFEEAPFMFLYHCNIGYPLLDVGSKVVIPSRMTVLKGEENQETKLPWAVVSAPRDGCQEQVFYHDLSANSEENTYAAIVNEKLGIGIMLKYKNSQFPNLTQWKSMASGDYVMGLEPCNCHVGGRNWERQHGIVQSIASYEKKIFDMDIIILDKEKGIWIK